MDRNSWTIWDRNSWPYLIVSWQCMQQVMMVHCHFQDGFRRNKDSETTNIEPVWSNLALLHWHGCVIGPGNLSELPKTCLLCLKFWPLTTTTRQSSFRVCLAVYATLPPSDVDLQLHLPSPKLQESVTSGWGTTQGCLPLWRWLIT